MSEHDIVVQKLDQILTILQSNTGTPPVSNNSSNTSSNTTSNGSFISVVQEVKTLLENANGVSSYVMNQTTINGQTTVKIEIRE